MRVRFMNGLMALCASLPTLPAMAQAPFQPEGCHAVGHAAREPSAMAGGAGFPPPQLSIRTPVSPTVFASAGSHYLLYELHLQNFSGEPMRVRAVEVVDAARPAAAPLARFTGGQLDQLIRPTSPSKDPSPLGELLQPGQGAVAFLCLAFERKLAVPSRLTHRLVLEDGVVQGPAIGTRTTALRVLGPPVTGPGWIASNATANTTHHRAGLLVFNGQAQISRRYSIDWKKWRDGAPFKGNEKDVRSHFAYGENLIAVADGVVVAAIDGFPDNVPRTADGGFTPAVPITLASIAGNMVVIDLGGGQFAQYAHMKAGSLQVKNGQRVRRGQLLGQIGNSGDARLPHVHFQVADGPDLLASEGLPYLIDSYRLKMPHGQWETRTRELPLRDMLIDFAPLSGKP